MKVEFTGTPQEIKKEMQTWLGKLDESNQEEAIIEMFDITGDPGDRVLVNYLKWYCKENGLKYSELEQFLRESGSAFIGKSPTLQLDTWIGVRTKEEK